MKKVVLAILLALLSMAATRSVVAQRVYRARVAYWGCGIQRYELYPPVPYPSGVGAIIYQKPGEPRLGELGFTGGHIKWLEYNGEGPGCNTDGSACEIFHSYLGGDDVDSGEWYIYEGYLEGAAYDGVPMGNVPGAFEMTCEPDPEPKSDIVFTAYLPVIQQPVPKWEID